MAKQATLTAIILTAACSAACLQKDVTETWYFDAQTGAVTWSVLEDHVRSDAQAPADRQIEETNYWLDVQRQDHPIARGLRQLGFGHPRTRVLRDTVPYSVLTDAKMGRIDMLGDRLIAHLRLHGTSVLVRTGSTWEWTMKIEDAGTETVGPKEEDVEALVDGFDGLTVMLTGGRFDDATGFTLSGDRTAAKFQEPSQETASASGQAAHDGTSAAPMVFRLRWTSR